LKIEGDLTDHGEADPDNARLLIQDWGTPWTEYEPDAASAEDWEDAFSWFLSCFYIGQ
jgi:hypothetical protein